MKLLDKKGFLIPLIFLLLAFTFLLKVTTNLATIFFNLDIQIILVFFILLLVVITFNFSYFFKRSANIKRLIFIDIMAITAMLFFLYNADVVSVKFKKDIRISKSKINRDLGIRYRLTTENFYNTNRKFFLEIFFEGNKSKDMKIKLPMLDKLVDKFLMYVDDEDFYRGKNGERLIPSTVEFILTNVNDSLILTTGYNPKQIVRHLILLENSSSKYLDHKPGDILNNSVRVFGESIDMIISGKDTIKIYE